MLQNNKAIILDLAKMELRYAIASNEKQKSGSELVPSTSQMKRC